MKLHIKPSGKTIPLCRRRSGFTLLEIMVAISLIAIVLVSIYKLHAQTIRMNMDAKFYATAPFLAQKKLAETELASPADVTDDSGTFDGEFSDYTWRIAVEDMESEVLGSTAEDMKRIDIAIGFNEDEFTYGLRTYRFVRE
jgi:general secretion pathway protein I